MADPFAADLRLRLASAIVLVAIAAIAVWWSPWSFAAMVAIAAVVLALEWSHLCGERRLGLSGLTQALALVVIVVAATLGNFDVALALVPLAAAAAWLAAGRGAVDRPGWSALGPLYVGVPCIAILWLRSGDDAGRDIIIWLLVAVSGADIGAYFAGRLIGGPKLAPRISPNKTWAGLAGAVAGAAGGGVAVGAVMTDQPPAALLALAGVAVAIVAQLGDLAESAIKRHFGVKDSGHLIPGHGGLFDRVDGLLAAATVFALWQWSTEGSVLTWR